MQLDQETLLAPQPATKRNFTTHLSYNGEINALGYPCGKSAFIRFLDDENEESLQFTGHGTSIVTVVKIAPSSNLVCSGDESGKVIVWEWLRDHDTGELTTRVKGEFAILAGPIADISWDMESRRLCVVGEGRDKFGAFISYDTGNSLGEISGHAQRINACAIKPSRPMRAMTVGDDAAVVFYSGPPFKFAASDRLHHEGGKFVRDVQFSPGSGAYVATVGSDRRIALFDGKSGDFIKYVEDASTPIKGGLFALAWIDEKQLAVASADATVKLYNVDDNKCVASWEITGGASATDNQQVGLVAMRDEKLLSLSLDGTFNILEIGQPTPVKTILGHQKGITALNVEPLCTGSYDGKVMDWNAKKVTQQHLNLVVSIYSDASQVASISWDSTLKVSDEVRLRFDGLPRLASHHKKLSAAVIDDDKLIVFDTFSGDVKLESTLSEPVSALTISANYIVVGLATSHKCLIFDNKDLKTVSETAPMIGEPTSLAISPSQAWLVGGDSQGKCVLYNLKSGEIKTSRWSFHTSRIQAIAWQPNTKEDLVATCSIDTNIYIYSVEKPMRTIKRLNAHKDGVNSIAWIAENNLVSVGADACIKKWKLRD